MRARMIAVFGLVVAVIPVCFRQNDKQSSNSEKSLDSSPNKLLLEVLETDLGIGGTNQFVYVRVFSDGSIEYHPKRFQDLRKQHASQGKISKEDLDAIAGVLTRKDVAELPSLFKSTYVPIDSYWDLDFTIPRSGETQKIQVVNFSPTKAIENKKAYPQPLVRLVCAAWGVRKLFSTEMPDLSQHCQQFVLRH
jgi:hypothetical protein